MLQEYLQADAAYRRAIELRRDDLPAWKGLSELHANTGDTEKSVEATERLVRPAGLGIHRPRERARTDTAPFCAQH